MRRSSRPREIWHRQRSFPQHTDQLYTWSEQFATEFARCITCATVINERTPTKTCPCCAPRLISVVRLPLIIFNSGQRPIPQGALFKQDHPLKPSTAGHRCPQGRTLQIAKEVLAKRGLELPHHCAFQADNTCREQRNSWTFLFSSWLVAHGIMRTVDELYYRVGHTHNECDQRFFVIASALSREPTLQSPEDRLLQNK